MKYLLIAIQMGFLVSIISCRPSEKSGEFKKEDKYELILNESEFLESASLSPLDHFVKGYADSINHINSEKDIPAFISNPQLDYERTGVLAPSHHPLPLRYMIIERVNNCYALKLLIQSSNLAFRSKPVKMYDIDVDFIELSFYAIALNRYKKMKCSS